MNQALYNDLLNASLVLVAQKGNRQKIQDRLSTMTALQMADMMRDI